MNFYKLRHILSRIADRGQFIAWIGVIILIGASIYFYLAAEKETQLFAKDRFNSRVNEALLSISKRMNAYEQVLRGYAGLFNASEQVTREDWKNYFNSLGLKEEYPGILGIGFSEKIEPDELDEHILQIRAEGFDEYTVWPEYERDEYTSIIYLEPFDEMNKRAFGYDMFSHPIRRSAMIRARDSAATSISGRTILVQESDQNIQFGILMYTPLYKKNTPISTVEQRRGALLGYIYSPFRMDDLMRGILENTYRKIDLKIYDGNLLTDSTLMYSGNKELDPSHEPIFTDTVRMKIKGAEWSLVFNSLPDFEKDISLEKPFVILISGILISLMFFIVALSLLATRKFYKKLDQILESTSEGIYGIDTEGNCTFVNRSALQMLGYKEKDIIGKKTHQLIHHSYEDGTAYPPQECKIMIALKKLNASRADDEVYWRSDGTSFPVEYSSHPIIQNGILKGGVIAFNDITERKTSAEMLENSLFEKEILLKELHHRVKNNMQIISSLLNLQSSYINNPLIVDMFKESQNRIKSMALIHEKLYQTKELARINLKDYIKDLAGELVRSYKSNNNSIEVKTDIPEVYTGLDSIIYLGLIINELLTNSLKHAFNKSGDGIIQITITQIEKSGIELVISDNGKGFPENFDLAGSETLGLSLVNSLVDQLGGRIEYSSIEGNTEFRILIMNILK
jgi:PAS domain S-box-containing protein